LEGLQGVEMLRAARRLDGAVGGERNLGGAGCRSPSGLQLA
jgi:hypothetical protein